MSVALIAGALARTLVRDLVLHEPGHQGFAILDESRTAPQTPLACTRRAPEGVLRLPPDIAISARLALDHPRDIACPRTTAEASCGLAPMVTAVAPGRSVRHNLPASFTSSSGPTDPLTGRPSADRLTAREREVAGLIARGHSNRQIGEALVITERTVAAHVEHILNKLGFTSRTQIGVWAAEHGLVVSDSA